MNISQSPTEGGARASSVSRRGAEAQRVVLITPNEHACLLALGEGNGEWAYNFNGIARDSGLPRPVIRRHVRALARKGLAAYVKGLWHDDGRPAGAGYRITKLGIETLSALEPEPVLSEAEGREPKK